MFSVQPDSFQHKKQLCIIMPWIKSVVIKESTFTKITMVQLRLRVVAADVILVLETSCLHLHYHGFNQSVGFWKADLGTVRQGINDHSSMSSILMSVCRTVWPSRVIRCPSHDLPLHHTLDL